MTAPSTQVTSLLTQFGLTTAAEEMVPRLTQAGHPEAMPVLVEVFEAEAEARRQRRITRLRRASRLPPGKTFATLDTGRFPAPVAQQLETLATGAFLETAANVLAFGLPGVGKSHALCAVGHALVEAGHSVLCAPYHGVLAPRAAWRADVVRFGEPVGSHENSPPEDSRDAAGAGDPPPAANGLWAEFIRRSFGFDVLECPRRGRRLQLIAVIEDPAVIERILRHPGLPTDIPEARPARPPPMPFLLDGLATAGGDDQILVDTRS